MPRRRGGPPCPPVFLGFFLGLLVLVVQAVLTTSLSAHEYHTSLAEVEFNPETHQLEVALRLIPEDLEAALSHVEGKPVNLDATEAIDDLLVAYLDDRFRLVDDEGRGPSLVWVGKEVSHEAAWLYFEIPVDLEVVWKLEHRVLFDLEPSQVNTVLFRHGDKSATWTLKVGKSSVRLPSLVRRPVHDRTHR